MEGKVKKLLEISREKMDDAAERQEYERAAQWRDLIYTLENIKEKPKMISVGLENKDIIGFAREKNDAVLYVFMMRKGKVSESESCSMEETVERSPQESLPLHVDRFYRKRKSWPDKILLPFQPDQKKKLEDRISRRAGKKMALVVPIKGKNKKLVELANRNADISLREKSERRLPLAEIQRLLGLERIPRRIEGFDISNTGGEESVGSVVVFEQGQPQKKEYRKFRIKTVKGPDDVASLQEIVRRRYIRLNCEKKPLPDLVFVDGGKGQLHAAKKALARMGLEDLPVASLAKKEEIVYSPTHAQGLKLDRTSPALKLLQNIRDEAHRFAISYHRKKRKKKSFQSELDGIPGLGPKRKALILTKYGSLGEIKKSSVEELTKLVGKKVAAKIHEKFERKK
jgi:excinuclease ABC subunit C